MRRPTERPRQNTGRRVGARQFLTTEYTEAGEPYLKITEMGLEGLGGKTGLGGLISVGEWSDFSV